MKLAPALALGSVLAFSPLAANDAGKDKEKKAPENIQAQVRKEVTEALRAAQLPVTGMRDYTFRDGTKGLVVEVTLPKDAFGGDVPIKGDLYFSLNHQDLARGWRVAEATGSVQTADGKKQMALEPFALNKTPGVYILESLANDPHTFDVYLMPRGGPQDQAKARKIIEDSHFNFTAFLSAHKRWLDRKNEKK